MIWLTWRQFRAQALVVFAAVALLLAALAATGPQLADLYRTLGSRFLNQISSTDQAVYYVGTVAVLLLPAVIGMFWGAPLITRELEAGTHRLVWNQTISRTRWLATKLGLTGLATMAAAGAASLLVTWWCGPIDQAVNSGAGGDGAMLLPRISPVIFVTRGVAPIGYAAFAFALGVTVGVLIRRTLPAMATTLAVFIAAQIATPLWVRPHLAGADHITVPITAGTFMNISGTTVTVNIHQPGAWLVSEQTVNAAGHPVGVLSSFLTCAQSATPKTFSDCVTGLTRLGYRQLATYQPAGHFWTLQWAETGVYLALALLLAGVSTWWVRRRLT